MLEHEIFGQYEELQKKARTRLIKMHYESNAGHAGGNLSALDILLCLHHGVIKKDDLFVLSKGHAAGALYITLWTMGKIPETELSTFHKDGTRLSGHPPVHGLPEVQFATGSLGHGLSLAAGLALAKKLKREKGRIYCLTSDGEWNEGSCWEALIFAQHHKLDNLTFIVDSNGLQGFGTTKEVADLGSLAEKFKIFGVETLEVNGHDPSSILSALKNNTTLKAIVAKTMKGKGASFMENKMEWHYLPMTKDQFLQATEELA